MPITPPVLIGAIGAVLLFCAVRSFVAWRYRRRYSPPMTCIHESAHATYVCLAMPDLKTVRKIVITRNGSGRVIFEGRRFTDGNKCMRARHWHECVLSLIGLAAEYRFFGANRTLREYPDRHWETQPDWQEALVSLKELDIINMSGSFDCPWPEDELSPDDGWFLLSLAEDYFFYVKDARRTALLLSWRRALWFIDKHPEVFQLVADELYAKHTMSRRRLCELLHIEMKPK